MYPTPDKGYEPPIHGKQITLAAQHSDKTITVSLTKPIHQPVINPAVAEYMLVVPDHVFVTMRQFAAKEAVQYYFGASYQHWEKEASIIQKLKRSFKSDDDINFTNRFELFYDMKRIFSLMLFTGFFVSALFLLAADSILYFKLYNDLEQDSKQYEALSKLGLTLKEMKQIAAKQVAILFFIPFAVAAVHAGFAFKMLQNMVSGSVVKTSVLVIILFFVVQLGYYFLIRSLYTKKVEQVM
ncbi:ABC transporter permease [Parageobacillus thermoglucosidasius]|uniref:ABC transporter permease n=1 Tax=Parageobacillus thermoglucosidasius TaxID=1426 RepID=UPI001FCB28C2|nr:FtsX-like permease family protein [Parageobacillus thermoglucosidasius]BDG33428.1 hypothetical protein PthBH41_31400 [Parageobacillus thermoglucosidasius]